MQIVFLASSEHSPFSAMQMLAGPFASLFAVLRVGFYSSLPTALSPVTVVGSCNLRCCFRAGCLRLDTLTCAFSVVVVGGFSKSSNCLSVKMPLYQSALLVFVFGVFWQPNETRAKDHCLSEMLFVLNIKFKCYHSGILRAQSHRLDTSSKA